MPADMTPVTMTATYRTSEYENGFMGKMLDETDDPPVMALWTARADTRDHCPGVISLVVGADRGPAMVLGLETAAALRLAAQLTELAGRDMARPEAPASELPPSSLTAEERRNCRYIASSFVAPLSLMGYPPGEVRRIASANAGAMVGRVVAGLTEQESCYALITRFVEVELARADPV